MIYKSSHIGISFNTQIVFSAQKRDHQIEYFTLQSKSSEPLDKIPHKIKRLVYLDGYIPQDNKSAFDIIPGLETIYKERALREEGKEWLVAPYEPEVWGVTDPADLR